MRELYEKLDFISSVQRSLHLCKMQKEDFIKKWEGKEHIPVEVADTNKNMPPIIIFLPKIKAVESIEEKIRFHESELKEQKLEAIKEMQRLIEEWK